MTAKIKERRSHYLELQPSQFEWPRGKKKDIIVSGTSGSTDLQKVRKTDVNFEGWETD